MFYFWWLVCPQLLWILAVWMWLSAVSYLWVFGASTWFCLRFVPLLSGVKIVLTPFPIVFILEDRIWVHSVCLCGCVACDFCLRVVVVLCVACGRFPSRLPLVLICSKCVCGLVVAPVLLLALCGCLVSLGCLVSCEARVCLVVLWSVYW